MSRCYTFVVEQLILAACKRGYEGSIGKAVECATSYSMIRVLNDRTSIRHYVFDLNSEKHRLVGAATLNDILGNENFLFALTGELPKADRERITQSLSYLSTEEKVTLLYNEIFSAKRTGPNQLIPMVRLKDPETETLVDALSEEEGIVHIATKPSSDKTP